MEKRLILGICPSRNVAERAVSRLKDVGLKNTDVSVLFNSSENNKVGMQNSTKAPEGAATGTLSGATIGGVLGWLAGIGALAIPGAGPFIAAGPIMAALAGAGVGGALSGVTGSLIGFGIPEYEAKRYEDRIKAGGVLVVVNVYNDKDAERARSILTESGAENLSEQTASDDNDELPRTEAVG